MLDRGPNLINPSLNLIFTDGTNTYNKIKGEFLTHRNGLFILAPSGAGKTHFIKNQEKKDWIDGDILWEAANAHPNGEWWLDDIAAIDEIDQRSDVITVQAKKQGFWIMGASNFWLVPDAIVMPNWRTHKKYIIKREQNNYDGGATSKNFDQVLAHRKVISKWAKRGVLKFNSIENAVKFLTNKI